MDLKTFINKANKNLSQEDSEILMGEIRNYTKSNPLRFDCVRTEGGFELHTDIGEYESELLSHIMEESTIRPKLLQLS